MAQLRGMMPAYTVPPSSVVASHVYQPNAGCLSTPPPTTLPVPARNSTNLYPRSPPRSPESAPLALSSRPSSLSRGTAKTPRDSGGRRVVAAGAGRELGVVMALAPGDVPKWAAGRGRPVLKARPPTTLPPMLSHLRNGAAEWSPAGVQSSAENADPRVSRLCAMGLLSNANSGATKLNPHACDWSPGSNGKEENAVPRLDSPVPADDVQNLTTPPAGAIDSPTSIDDGFRLPFTTQSASAYGLTDSPTSMPVERAPVDAIRAANSYSDPVPNHCPSMQQPPPTTMGWMPCAPNAFAADQPPMVPDPTMAGLQWQHMQQMHQMQQNAAMQMMFMQQLQQLQAAQAWGAMAPYNDACGYERVPPSVGTPLNTPRLTTPLHEPAQGRIIGQSGPMNMPNTHKEEPKKRNRSRGAGRRGRGGKNAAAIQQQVAA